MVCFSPNSNVFLLQCLTCSGGNLSPNSPITNGASAKPNDDWPLCKTCKKHMNPIHYDAHIPVCADQKKKELAKRKKQRKEAKALEAAAKAKEEAQAPDKAKESDPTAKNAPSASQDNGDDEKASLNGDTLVPPTAQAAAGTKKPPKKSATKTAPGDKKTKKRKADAEAAEKEPKKKKTKKEEEKAAGPKTAKVAKPKGPVNVELQCGVQLDPEKGGFCARSLTCKSHSMGLKRAVPGRSLPYDQLLANYQKKNHAKQQKLLLEAQSGAHPADEEAADAAAVDSDEEKEAVVKGLSRWRPRPLEQVISVGVNKYKYVRLKEALGSALAGTPGGGQRLFGVPAPGPALGHDADAMDLASDGPQRIISATETGRKGSIASAGGGSAVSASHGHPTVPKGVAVPVRKASIASSAGAA